MTIDLDNLVQRNLAHIHSEMKLQVDVARHYPKDRLSFEDEMEQLREYIYDAREYAIAYESIVAEAEDMPFVFSSQAAVKLLEVGLILGYKTERTKDRVFGEPRF